MEERTSNDTIRPIRRVISSSSALDALIACHECDALHRKTPLGKYAVARCTRCGWRIPDKVETMLALALVSALIFVIAHSSPIIERLNAVVPFAFITGYGKPVLYV